MESYLKVKQAINKKFPLIEGEESLEAAVHLMAQNNVSAPAACFYPDLQDIPVCFASKTTLLLALTESLPIV
jgi:hypothetical protein